MHSQSHSITPETGDFIYQLAAPSSVDEDIAVLFAARISGLYRSTDRGQTWHSAYQSLNVENALPTIAIALAPDFKNEPHVFAGLNGVILCSYDGGMIWHQCQLPSPPPAISSLVTSPNYTNDGIVYAGTNEDGVLVSNDRGQRWIPWNFGLLDLEILCMAISPDFTADETLYAGTVSGLFRSTNGGRAWREVTLPIGFDAVLGLAISPKFSQDNTLFVGTENNGLMISQDRGKSWHAFTENIAEQPINSVLLSPNFPNDPMILILHGGALLASRDYGKTWKPWQSKKLGDRNITAVFAPYGFQSGVFVGFEDGSVIRIGAE